MNFLILGGYGQYVWTSFVLTFASYYFLYFKTFRELKIQEEKLLSEIKNQTIKKIIVKEYKSVPKSSLSNISIV